MKTSRQFYLILGLFFGVLKQPFALLAQVKPAPQTQAEIVSTPALRPAWINSQAQSTEPILIILGYFPDTDRGTFTKTTQDDWAGLFFGAKPSVKNYFEKISFNKVSFTPAADTDSKPGNGIVGWYQLINNFDFYRQQYGDEYFVYMAREAIVSARNDLDFAKYDANSNGYIEPHELHIYVIVAAFDLQFGKYGTPDDPKVHRVRFPLVSRDGTHNVPAIVDGVRIGVEAFGGGVCFAGELLYKYEEVLFGIRKHSPSRVTPISHELGHDFGLPDHYKPPDLAGTWCIMGTDIGVEDLDFPNAPCAPHRAQLRWITPEKIGANQSRLIEQIAASGTNLLLWENGNPRQEYFHVENRNNQPVNEYDSQLPSSGLLIWHVDSTRAFNDDTQGIALEHATTQSDAFNAVSNASFPPTGASPNSRSNQGLITGVSIAKISSAGSNMAAEISVTHMPVGISLLATPSAINANGTGSATITAGIIDLWNEVFPTAVNPVSFTITSGGASATLVGPNPVNAVNGVATITLQATTTPGLITIEAQSQGLNSAITTVSVYSNPTQISSHITTNTTWTLAKSPYLVTTDIEVKAGVTLTIDPGVTVLFRSNTDLTVNGTIIANGTSTQHIAFTSSSTTPVIGAWGGLFLNVPQGPLRSSFNYCDFSYGGQGGLYDYDDVFEMSGYAEPQISNCTIRNSRRNGIELQTGGYSSNFRLNVTDLPLMVLGDITIGANARMTIDPGVRLKFARDADFYVQGALNAQGTPSQRIIFTSLRDDAVDGDTGGDGETTGRVADWGGIYFYASVNDAECKLTYCDFKFSGQGGLNNFDTPLRLEAQANPTFQALRFFDCRYHGIDVVAGSYSANIVLNQTAAPYIIRGDLTMQKPGVLTVAPGVIVKLFSDVDLNIYGGLVCQGTAANPIRFTSIRDDNRGGDTGNDGPTLAGAGDWGGVYFDVTAQGSNLNFCEFHYGGDGGYGNNGRPVLLNLQADVAFANLTFTNNTSNGITIVNGEYGSDVRLRFAGKTPYLQFGDIAINAGAKLTIEPGCILKLNNGCDFYINGGLKAEGTPVAPIIFTSMEDDSLWGDSNNNGHSLGLPGQWGGIAFGNTAVDSVSRMRHCQFRFGGGGGYGNVGWVIQVSPLVNPVFQNLRFVRNIANGIYLAEGAYSSNVLFDQIAAPYFLSGDYVIEMAGSLMIAPGTLFKCYGTGTDIYIRSRLTAVGTPAAPIIFTSYRDDRFGGDTNNDGATNGAAGDWGGILFQTTSVAGASEVAYSELWYGAAGGYGNANGALHCETSAPKIHHIKIRQMRGHGVYASGNASPDLGGGAYLSPGQNSFLDFNTTSNSYAVYNDGSATIFAKNNTWDGATMATIAQDIYDKTDNAAKGQVIFDPFILPGDNEAPQMTVLFPNGGETLKRGQVATLRWFARDNVGVIKIDLALSRDGGQLFQPLTSLTTQEEYKWNAIGPFSSRCLLKVTGRDAAGNERFDVSDNFFAIVDSSSGVNYPPSIPRLLRPLAGEEMRGSDLLIWQASVDPNPFDEIRYRLEIDDNGNFSSPELVEENIDSSRTSIVSENLEVAALASSSVIAIRLDKLAGFANLQDDVVYYWRVRARDQQNAASAYSDGTARFFMNKTNTSPQAVVTGFSPANNVEARTARPTISWQAADDPDPSDGADILRYLLQMDDDGEFAADVEIPAATPAGVTFHIPTQNLKENARYSYRVQARDDEDAVSPWSAVQSFFVNAIKEPPSLFAIRAPAPRFVAQSDTVTFQWDTATDPDPLDSVRYVMEWSLNRNFSPANRLSYSSQTTRTMFLRPSRVDSVFWRLYAIDADTLATYASNSLQQPRVIRWQITAVSSRENDLPTTFSLAQNYPNPFNPETEIRFQLPQASHVVLKIFNTLGREIITLADGQYQAGYHHIRWNGKDENGNPLASGIYLYQLHAGNFSQVRKISLLR